jgi:hypothetical protein
MLNLGIVISLQFSGVLMTPFPVQFYCKFQNYANAKDHQIPTHSAVHWVLQVQPKVDQYYTSTKSLANTLFLTH